MCHVCSSVPSGHSSITHVTSPAGSVARLGRRGRLGRCLGRGRLGRLVRAWPLSAAAPSTAVSNSTTCNVDLETGMNHVCCSVPWFTQVLSLDSSSARLVASPQDLERFVGQAGAASAAASRSARSRVVPRSGRARARSLCSAVHPRRSSASASTAAGGAAAASSRRRSRARSRACSASRRPAAAPGRQRGVRGGGLASAGAASASAGARPRRRRARPRRSR